MKAFTFLLALLGLLTIAIACKDNEKWCCSDSAGCECENNQVATKHNCQEGTYCAMDAGIWTCRARRQHVSRTDTEDDITAEAKTLLSDLATFDESAKNGVSVADTAAENGAFCGMCINEKGKTKELRTGSCNNVDDGQKYYACNNNWCGICMLFL